VIVCSPTRSARFRDLRQSSPESAERGVQQGGKNCPSSPLSCADGPCTTRPRRKGAGMTAYRTTRLDGTEVFYREASEPAARTLLLRRCPQNDNAARQAPRAVDLGRSPQLRSCRMDSGTDMLSAPKDSAQRSGSGCEAQRQLVGSAPSRTTIARRPHCRAGHRNGSEIGAGARGEWSMAVRKPAVVVAALAERGRADHVRLLPPRGHRRFGLGSPSGSAAEILVP